MDGDFRDRFSSSQNLSQSVGSVMKGRGLLVLLLSGCVLLCRPQPHRLTRRYHRVDQTMIWSEARRHCRETFTDLATIRDQGTNAEVQRVAGSGRKFWIGLFNSSWRRSTGPLEDNWYRNWSDGEPSYWRCVITSGTLRWYTRDCEDKYYFLCYDDQNHDHKLVTELKTWSEAQDYCRKKHHDMSAIRNAEISAALKSRIRSIPHGTRTLAGGLTVEQKYGSAPAVGVWFGLYRPEWDWSDGSDAPYRQWENEGGVEKGNCGMMSSTSGKWFQHPCKNKYAFICYSDIKVSASQTMKVRLTTSADLNDRVVQESILQQMRQKLADGGLTEEVKLRWRKQPDGKIFHREEEEEAVPPAGCGSV